MPDFGPLEVVVLLAMVALIVLVVRTIASFVVREIARKQVNARAESRAPEGFNPRSPLTTGDESPAEAAHPPTAKGAPG
jgi:hypothetical protein